MNTVKQEQLQASARLEMGIWDALIGAHGSPAIQKFVIQQKLYAFARAAVNVSHDTRELEMRKAHSMVKLGMGAKVKKFIDFIEGDLSLGEALEIRDALQEKQSVPILQLTTLND